MLAALSCTCVHCWQLESCHSLTKAPVDTASRTPPRRHSPPSGRSCSSNGPGRQRSSRRSGRGWRGGWRRRRRRWSASGTQRRRRGMACSGACKTWRSVHRRARVWIAQFTWRLAGVSAWLANTRLAAGASQGLEERQGWLELAGLFPEQAPASTASGDAISDTASYHDALAVKPGSQHNTFGRSRGTAAAAGGCAGGSGCCGCGARRHVWPACCGGAGTAGGGGTAGRCGNWCVWWCARPATRLSSSAVWCKALPVARL